MINLISIKVEPNPDPRGREWFTLTTTPSTTCPIVPANMKQMQPTDLKTSKYWSIVKQVSDERWFNKVKRFCDRRPLRWAYNISTTHNWDQEEGGDFSENCADSIPPKSPAVSFLNFWRQIWISWSKILVVNLLFWSKNETRNVPLAFGQSK